MTAKCAIAVSWFFATVATGGLLALDQLGVTATTDFGRACLFFTVGVYVITTFCVAGSMFCIPSRSKAQDIGSVDSESVDSAVDRL